jgi:hypothetical protein
MNSQDVKNNALKGKISTILGGIIILTGIVTIFHPMSNLGSGEPITLITIGTGLIGLINK